MDYKLPEGLTANEYIRQLKEERAEKMSAMDVLTAKDDLNEKDSKSFDELNTRINAIDEVLPVAEADAKRNAAFQARKNGARKVTTPEEKVQKGFSFTKFMREAVEQSTGEGRLTGLEAEMAQEAKTEARGFGQHIKGVGIPSAVLGVKREVQVGVPGQGGNLVEDGLPIYIQALQNKMVLTELGVDYLPGLVGDLPLTSEQVTAAATWGTEVQAIGQSLPTWGRATLTPRRLGTFLDVSRMMLAQDSVQIEAILRNQMVSAAALAIQNAAINGTGLLGQPLGLLNEPLLDTTLIGGNPDGGPMTWALAVGLESRVSLQNADFGKLGYLTNAACRGHLKTVRKDAGSGKFLYEDGEMNTYKLAVTNQVPSNGAKGAGVNLSTLIFGNFGDMKIGQWGGLDMIIDPYTQATTGEVRMIMNQFVDVVNLRVASFAAIVDINTV